MQNLREKVHLIAIGEPVMHQLALALQKYGITTTGSDDEFEESIQAQLTKDHLLPERTGWFPERITHDLDFVIIGSKVKADNPELLKAKEIGLRIFSFPEYLFQKSLDKQRIVITGSHGKTTIAAMVLHVLQYFNRKFDYYIGANIDGLENKIRLSEVAPIIIIEGDEYFTSTLDSTPLFLHYKHHIGLVSGIAWDHVNFYSTFEEYVKKFEAFADSTPKGGILIYNEEDPVATLICQKEREDVQRVDYSAHKNDIIGGITHIITKERKIPLKIFGKHNMKNLCGAKAVCSKIGISDPMFYEAIESFPGVPERFYLVNQSAKTTIYTDISQSPSKVKASTHAVKKQFPQKNLVAVLELNNNSNLNKNFIGQYRDTLESADESIIYLNLDLQKKINPEELKVAFNNKKLLIFNDGKSLQDHLLNKIWENKTLLFMTSGDFDGLDINELSKNIINNNFQKV